MHPYLRSTELKLKRSNALTFTLVPEVRAWREGSNCKSRIELFEDKMGFRVIHDGYKEPPRLDDWSLTVGEIVHNLRSALENLVFALGRLEKDPPEDPKCFKFPICTKESDFKKETKKLELQISAGALALIDSYQPYHRDDWYTRSLLRIQSINNADKHQIPRVATSCMVPDAHMLMVAFENEVCLAPQTTRNFADIESNLVIHESRYTKPLTAVGGLFLFNEEVRVLDDGVYYGFESLLVSLHNHCAFICRDFYKFFE